MTCVLYVPGDRPDRIAKARLVPHAVPLIDLEDSVAPAKKDFARLHLRDALNEDAGSHPWIRINGNGEGRADLAALRRCPIAPTGLVLSKCESALWVDEVAQQVGHGVRLIPLIESAQAVRNLDELCSHPNVTQCHLGEIDLLADVGCSGSASLDVLRSVRVEVVLASAAARIQPPIAGVFLDVRDLDGLAEDSEYLANLGFAGRPAIHPSQVSVINDAFQPSAEEVAWATSLVTLYDDALREGVGVIVDESGQMVDEAVVRRARRVLTAAS